MNASQVNKVSTHSILQDGIGKLGLFIASILLSINFTELFPYALLIVSSVMLGYFLSKMRDEKQVKVIQNEKINLFESMIHQSNDIIMLYNPEESKYEYANHTSEVELGLGSKNGKNIDHPEFENIRRAELLDMIDRLEDGERSEFNFEVKAIKTDGTEATFETVLERIIIDSKNYIKLNLHEITEVKTQVAEMNQDINNYEEVIQQYKNSNREMEAYAATMAAYDLQQPIRKIVNEIKELESESWFKLDMEEKDNVTKIKENASRLASMIEDVIAFSAVGSNTTFLEMNPINPMIQEVVDQLEFKIQETNAIIEFAELPEMIVDHKQIKHLFKNLIENAIDNRGEEAPEIMIGCTQEDQDWKITVSDNCGMIDQEQQEKVFDSFWKLNNTAENGKTGINLAICKKIILNHNGSIGIESENEGTTIFFTIPMSTSDQVMHA